MNPSDFTQLGVSGVIVAMLLIAVKVLWTDNKELREQARADQQTVLPVLTAASTAIEASQQLSQQLIDRLADIAIPHGDGR